MAAQDRHKEGKGNEGSLKAHCIQRKEVTKEVAEAHCIRRGVSASTSLNKTNLTPQPNYLYHYIRKRVSIRPNPTNPNYPYHTEKVVRKLGFWIIVGIAHEQIVKIVGFVKAGLKCLPSPVYSELRGELINSLSS
jgi:hypothetical protein